VPRGTKYTTQHLESAVQNASRIVFGLKKHTRESLEKDVWGNNSKASCAKLGKVYNASSNKCRDKCKGNPTYTTQTYKGKTRRRCA